MLNKNFREFIELLEKHAVKYLVVGGYAVGLHGFPRYTGDLDVFIALSPENAGRILQVFAEFGFADLGLKPDDFLEPDMVVKMGREPLKIQILTGIDGVTFDQCYVGRTMLAQGALKIPFIGFDQLLQNKTASPRGKDKIDLEELLKAKRGSGNSAT